MEGTDASLQILTGEIETRRKCYSEIIATLTEDSQTLKSKICQIRAERDETVKSLEESHESIISALKKEYEDQKSQMRESSRSKIEDYENRAIADILLFESKCDERASELSALIDSVVKDGNESMSASIEESDSQLQSVRLRIQGYKGKIRAVQSVIADITPNRLRKGPIITPYDRDIQRLAEDDRDLELKVRIATGKMDTQYQNARSLNEFTLKKLRRAIKSTRLRAEAAKDKIPEARQNHQVQMRKLRMQLLNLTNPTPVRTPSRQKLETIKDRIEHVNGSVSKVGESLGQRQQVLRKLQQKNEKLRMELRRRQFAIGFGTIPAAVENHQLVQSI
jgi:predicted DNA-binding ArsR family transcriptional regulator